MLPENARGYRHDLHEPAISVSSSLSDRCLACAAFPLLPTEDAVVPMVVSSFCISIFMPEILMSPSFAASQEAGRCP